LYDRTHTRLIADYGGIAPKVPIFAFLFLVFTLSSIALPLTNGFIGEFLILAGSYQVWPTATAIALLGVVLGAVYMLTLYLRVMFGEIDEEKQHHLTDVNRRELLTFVPLLVLVFVMGLFPQPFLARMRPSVEEFIKTTQERTALLRAYDATHGVGVNRRTIAGGDPFVREVSTGVGAVPASPRSMIAH
jgi:NADH-quinone oxidoreductase subunit M